MQVFSSKFPVWKWTDSVAFRISHVDSCALTPPDKLLNFWSLIFVYFCFISNFWSSRGWTAMWPKSTATRWLSIGEWRSEDCKRDFRRKLFGTWSDVSKTLLEMRHNQCIICVWCECSKKHGLFANSKILSSRKLWRNFWVIFGDLWLIWHKLMNLPHWSWKSSNFLKFRIFKNLFLNFEEFIL